MEMGTFTNRSRVDEINASISSISSPLVASCQHLLKPNGSISGRHVAEAILPLFPSMCSAIPSELGNARRPALGSIDGRQPISHTRIRDFILSEFGPALHAFGFGRHHRIALVLPNGPELALAILAISNWASCVPLNALGAKSELEADLKRCGADLVIGPSRMNFDVGSSSKKRKPNPFHVMPENGASKDFLVFDHIEECANQLRIPFIGLVPSSLEAGIFQLVGPRSAVTSYSKVRNHEYEADTAGGKSRPIVGLDNISRFRANGHDDEVLVLFTSGTTGNKKVVPHRLGDMLVASGTIAVSWDLKPNDINCNLMPLFHVGGIVRQVFSPILSGGCVICCPSFDPSIFWALLNRKAFTWYYAAPTMHQIILQTGKDFEVEDSQKLTNNQKPKLRMIANAAGGLLPSLARELRSTFSANVLPSYGMTECMPISSPPATYQLEKHGTSGVAVGPDIGILDLSTSEELPRGKEGPICVRGTPCFRGYSVDHSAPTEIGGAASFLEGGWFNTGDLGYMDSDGYLYITGRSKEVINRGGEIISPMEVEEAVLGHPGVLACTAISTPHDVLQEVVGIVVVPTPGRPRIDLQELHNYLGEERLAAPKWPQCLVFMDGLPKSHTNKLLRVKLGQRLGLPEMNDSLHFVERTFDAKCPPQGTSLETAISCERVQVSPQAVEQLLNKRFVAQHQKGFEARQIRVVRHPTRVTSLVCHVYNVDRKQVIEFAKENLHLYLMPSHFCVLDKLGTSDLDLQSPKSSDAVSAILQGPVLSTGPVDPLVQEIQQLLQDLLHLDCLPAAQSNFFNLGGSSMLASQLAAKIRKKHNIPFSGAEVFHHSSSEALASMIRDRQNPAPRLAGDGTNSINDGSQKAGSFDGPNDTGYASSVHSFHKDVDTQESPFHQDRIPAEKSCIGLLIQLFPLFGLFPIWQITRFFLFFSFLLVTLEKVPMERNLPVFVLTLVAFHLLWVTLAPLAFVLIKWIVIGKYVEGHYPLWGTYYFRWWFVDVCRKLFGRGAWGSNRYTLVFFYRLLGAKIGTDANISLEADIGEYDLVSIGKNAAIEISNLRPFGLDNGSMILGRVSVGAYASVGCRSVVAPFTSIPEGGHLGPVMSSYERGSSLDVKHLRVNRQALPQPSICTQLFLGGPITFFVETASHIPAFFVLWWMVTALWNRDDHFRTMSDLMEWLCNPRRIPFYLGLRIARNLLAPLVHMFCSILVKWTIIGRFQPGPRDTTSEWQLLRHWLAATLFSRQNMQEVTELIGRHYELVSCLYRLLGAKIGKRVFWPGHQPVFSGEFDLLEIGDDVVFGSRTIILCTTCDSCEKVILCAGANVSDNSVVMPGAIIGKNAVLGSTSICPEGRYLPENSVYFGCKGGEPFCLEKGANESGVPLRSADMDVAHLPFSGDESTLRPFGKAFYQGGANYWVYPLWFLIAFTWIVRALIASLHTLPLIASLHGAAGILYGYPIADRNYDSLSFSSTTVYFSILVVFTFVHSVRVILAFGIELAAKWTLIGRRKEGRYNYDTSTYAQNWELYQVVTAIRRNGRICLMDFIGGTPFMVEFFRLHGCKIGQNVCLFPGGGDPYMSEPDLVELGDNSAIDCAAMVTHLNTRGNFELSKIVVENNATLRMRSRIQSGCVMESGSMLLERSLAMTGDIIEADSVWQGSPAARLFSYTPFCLPDGPAEKVSSDFQGAIV